jgi:hypothetical protein
VPDRTDMYVTGKRGRKKEKALAGLLVPVALKAFDWEDLRGHQQCYSSQSNKMSYLRGKYYIYVLHGIRLATHFRKKEFHDKQNSDSMTLFGVPKNIHD